jgi:cell division protease FtsH
VLPEEDKQFTTRGEMIDLLAFFLGGRVAEELVLDDITTGAGDDIRKATNLARRMVTEFGMSELLGPLTLGQQEHEVFLGKDFAGRPDYSDRVAFEIDSEVRRLIDYAHDEALAMLKRNRAKLDEVAGALIERETLEKEELVAILESVKKKPRSRRERDGIAAVVEKRVKKQVRRAAPAAARGRKRRPGPSSPTPSPA